MVRPMVMGDASRSDSADAAVGCPSRAWSLCGNGNLHRARETYPILRGIEGSNPRPSSGESQQRTQQQRCRRIFELLRGNTIRHSRRYASSSVHSGEGAAPQYRRKRSRSGCVWRYHELWDHALRRAAMGRPADQCIRLAQQLQRTGDLRLASTVCPRIHHRHRHRHAGLRPSRLHPVVRP